MQNWSIRKQINSLSLLALVVTLLLLAVAVFSGWRLSGNFDEIRGVSEALTEANLILEDEIEARLDAKSFRSRRRMRTQTPSEVKLKRFAGLSVTMPRWTQAQRSRNSSVLKPMRKSLKTP